MKLPRGARGIEEPAVTQLDSRSAAVAVPHGVPIEMSLNGIRFPARVRPPAEVRVPAEIVLSATHGSAAGRGTLQVSDGEIAWTVPEHWNAPAWSGSVPIATLRKFRPVSLTVLEFAYAEHTTMPGSLGWHLDVTEHVLVRLCLASVADADRVRAKVTAALQEMGTCCRWSPYLAARL